MSDQVKFRLVDPGDLGSLLQILNDSWTMRHHWSMLNDYDEMAWFKALGDGTNVIRIATVGGTPVGLYRITRRDIVNKRGMSNIDIFANLRGRGLGTLVLQAGVSMAFNEFGIKTLDAEILVHNTASIRAHEKVGFRLSATRRKVVFLLGKHHDSHLYWLENTHG